MNLDLSVIEFYIESLGGEFRRNLMIISVRRSTIAAVLSILIEFYPFDFLPGNIAIMGNQSYAIQKVS